MSTYLVQEQLSVFSFIKKCHLGNMGMHYQMQDIVKPLNLGEDFNIKYTNLREIFKIKKKNPQFIENFSGFKQFKCGQIDCCAQYNGSNH